MDSVKKGTHGLMHCRSNIRPSSCRPDIVRHCRRCLSSIASKDRQIWKVLLIRQAQLIVEGHMHIALGGLRIADATLGLDVTCTDASRSSLSLAI